MQVNHTIFRVCYIYRPNSITCYRETDTLPKSPIPFYTDILQSPTMMELPAELWFEQMIYECQRMMLAVSKYCHKNRLPFHKKDLHWNMWTYTTSVENRFSFGSK